MKKFTSLLLGLIWLSLSSFQPDEIEMADGLRSGGLIFIVVMVVLIMVLGLVFYLFTLDMKISKLEKESSEPKKE
jgi:ABC-type transport system involved in cytochrome c biogenesis permease subunit